jgi:hypothetical protein
LPKDTIVEEFRALHTEEKLAVLRSLWDEVVEELEGRPATEAERRFLDDRLRDIADDPRPPRSWDEARDDLLAKR